MSAFQAQQLLANASRTSRDTPATSSSAPAAPEPPEEDDLEVVDDAEEDLEVVDDAPADDADDVVEVVETVEEPAPRPVRPAPRGGPAAGVHVPGALSGLEAAAQQVGGGAPYGAAAPYGSQGGYGAPAGFGATSGMGAGAGLGAGSLGGPAFGAPPKPKVAKSVWDSKLLLATGGILLLFLIMVPVLFFAIQRQTGDESFKIAEAAYNSGSYTQAIANYDQYLADFPDHKSASLARVHRGLARMRQAVDSSRNWPRTLELSQEVLGEIATEEDFSAARSELAAMLPKIAAGLAQSARRERDPKLIEQARTALELVQKHVPTAEQPEQELQDIEASLALTVRDLERTGELDKAIKKIEKAIAVGKPAESYAIRNELLGIYPDLATNERLQTAVSAAAERERELIRFIAEERAPLPAAADEPPLKSILLAVRSASEGAAAPASAGQPVYALSQGAVYAVDSGSGQVLWRRYVGETTFAPVPIGDGDALLHDAKRGELVRVAANTGEVRWRQALEGDCPGGPAVMGGKILAALRTGKLVTISAGTGAVLGSVTFNQGLRTRPVLSVRDDYHYQLGEHSNLYVMAADQGDCQAVIYLGHELSSITAPPLVVSRYLVVAENTGLEDSILRILLTDEAGPGAREVQRIKLEGHVHISPMVSGRTVLVSTDRGALYIFEVGSADQANPFVQTARKAAGPGRALIRQAVLAGSECWVADEQLTKYDILSAQGELAPRWVRHQNDVFLEPLRLQAETLLHVRQSPMGLVVAATASGDGAPLWETRLVPPPLGQPIVSRSTITVVTGDGSLFQADLASTDAPPALDQPRARPPADWAPSPGVQLASWPSGRVALGTSGTNKLLICDPAAAVARYRALTLPDALSGELIPWGENLLAPGKIGQVHLIDPSSGEAVSNPFQPVLASGVVLNWRGVAVPGDKEVILSDGHARLYRVGLATDPAPHIDALASAELAEPIVSSLAVLNKSVFGVDRGGRLVSYDLAQLKPQAQQPLGGGVAWGPAQLGGAIVLATANERLQAYGEDGSLTWEVPLKHGPLAGAPLAATGRLIVASTTGVLWSVSDKGQELGSVDLGQPLAGGPVLVGRQLAVATVDGSLILCDAAALRSPTP